MSASEESAAASASLDLPMASVNRAIKAAAIDNVIIAKDAKSAFCKAASVFILYLTATANDLCKKDKRSTINEKDVLRALEEIEFGEFATPAKELVQAFKQDRASKKRKVEESSKPAEGVEELEEEELEDEELEEVEEEE
jgi:DNA polymerase epsilon subunit 3